MPEIVETSVHGEILQKAVDGKRITVEEGIKLFS